MPYMEQAVNAAVVLTCCLASDPVNLIESPAETGSTPLRTAVGGEISATSLTVVLMPGQNSLMINGIPLLGRPLLHEQGMSDFTAANMPGCCCSSQQSSSRALRGCWAMIQQAASVHLDDAWQFQYMMHN
jgi:hypothetical protein